MRPTLLAVVLTASFATAPSLGFLEPLWSFLASFAEAGCGADPFGRCNPAPQHPTLESGCGFDPLGCPRGS